MVKCVPLSKGRSALVDDEDYAMLMQVKWSYSETSGAYRQIRGEERVDQQQRTGKHPNRQTPKRHARRSQLMAWIIMANELLLYPDYLVGFIDGDKLNLQKSNLRLLTTSQRCAASRKQNKCGLTSKYKGVCWDRTRNKWRAEIKPIGQKKKSLGRYNTERDAALVYNAAARKYFGEFAFTNEIELEAW